MVELPVDAVFASAFGLVLHRFTDLRLPVIELAGLLSLFSLTCSSFGLAVGSLFPQADVALAVGPAITVVYIILGVFGPAGINSKDLPGVLKPFRVLSPMRWACEALCAAEFEGQSFQPESSPVHLLRSGSSGNSNSNGISRQLLGTVRKIVQLVRGSGTILTHLLKQKRHSSSHKPMTDGDHVLENLGMTRGENDNNGSLVVRAVTMMGRLIGAHLLVALFGLIFQSKAT